MTRAVIIKPDSEEHMPKPDRRHDRLIRMKELKERTGFHPMTIYRRMAAGTFPASVQIGPNSVAWYETDLAAWLADPMGWRAPGLAA